MADEEFQLSVMAVATEQRHWACEVGEVEVAVKQNEEVEVGLEVERIVEQKFGAFVGSDVPQVTEVSVEGVKVQAEIEDLKEEQKQKTLISKVDLGVAFSLEVGYVMLLFVPVQFVQVMSVQPECLTAELVVMIVEVVVELQAEYLESKAKLELEYEHRQIHQCKARETIKFGSGLTHPKTSSSLIHPKTNSSLTHPKTNSRKRGCLNAHYPIPNRRGI